MSLAADTAVGRGRAEAVCQDLAMLILLAGAVGRLFVGELPFLQPVLSMVMPQAGWDTPPLNVQEASRVAFAVLMFAALALWLIGSAVGGRLAVRRRALAVMVAGFGALAMVSTLRADDRLSASIVWCEQTALVAGCWLAAQIFVDRRRFRLLVAALAAAGVTLALKGLHQALIEIPDMQAEARTILPGGKTMFEQLQVGRITMARPSGYVALSNVYAAALLIVGGALAGFLADRIAAARARGRAASLAIAQAIVAGLGLGLAVVILVSTESAGALVGALAAGAVGVGVAVFARHLRRHWRKAILVATVLIVIAGSAVVGYGLLKDRLPGKTMTVRWYYWTASAEIIRDRPIFGVGGGNFPDAYRRYRRAQAEETVRAPHNVMAHAITQFGLTGGTVYLAVLIYGLIGLARPGRAPAPKAGRPPPRIIAGVILPCVALGLRLAVGQAGRNVSLAIIDAIVPAGVFAALLWLFMRQGDAVPRAARIALAAALGGFVLHNTVSYGLWTPGVATTFWIVLGAVLAQSGPAEPAVTVRSRWPIAIGAIALTVAVALLAGRPTWAKTRCWMHARAALQDHRWTDALDRADAAVRADPRDAVSAAEAGWARVLLPPGATKERLVDAIGRMDEAIRRCPSSSRWHAAAARVRHLLAGLTNDEALYNRAADQMGEAVARDPMAPMLRIDYAEVLLGAGRAADALVQLRAAEAIDATRAADSLFRLRSRQRDRLEHLRQRANGAATTPARP